MNCDPPIAKPSSLPATQNAKVEKNQQQLLENVEKNVARFSMFQF